MQRRRGVTAGHGQLYRSLRGKKSARKKVDIVIQESCCEKKGERKERRMLPVATLCSYEEISLFSVKVLPIIPSVITIDIVITIEML